MKVGATAENLAPGAVCLFRSPPELIMTDTMPAVRNGVDTATLFATLDAVKADPEIAAFQFRATNTWVSGTHNRSTFHGFYGGSRRWSTSARTPSTPTIPQYSSVPTRGRPPSSFSCTPSQRA